MNKLDLTLDVATASYRPGEAIRGVIEWDMPSAPAEGVLTLRWRTSGAGDSDEHIVRQLSAVDLPSRRPAASAADAPYRARFVEDTATPLRSQDAREFHLTAPQGPYSFTGELIALVWELHVALGGYAATSQLVISPTAKVYVLGGDTDDYDARVAAYLEEHAGANGTSAARSPADDE